MNWLVKYACGAMALLLIASVGCSRRDEDCSLAQPVTLEIHLVVPCDSVQASKRVTDPQTRLPVCFDAASVVNEEDVRDAFVIELLQNRRGVHLVLEKQAGLRLRDFTTRNMSKRIVVLVNSAVDSIAMIVEGTDMVPLQGTVVTADPKGFARDFRCRARR